MEHASPARRQDVEPWLRGTLTEVAAVPRQVLHALELAAEDGDHWCTPLTDDEMHARPCSVASVAFHLRHIARSLDRLLTYAEGAALSDTQMHALHSEMLPRQGRCEIMEEFRTALALAAARVRRLPVDRLEEPRVVGRAGLPTTLGGLLVHCAEHTQRHAGQMVTTARIVREMRGESSIRLGSEASNRE